MKTMAKLRMAHASTHGARKPPGPKEEEEEERLNDGDNNGQATHGRRKHAWRTQAAWANWIIQLVLMINTLKDLLQSVEWVEIYSTPKIFLRSLLCLIQS